MKIIIILRFIMPHGVTRSQWVNILDNWNCMGAYLELLQHQAISIHSADKVIIVLGQFHIYNEH